MVVLKTVLHVTILPVHVQRVAMRGASSVRPATRVLLLQSLASYYLVVSQEFPS